MPDTVTPTPATLQQPATTPPMQEHGKHTTMDEADHVYKKIAAVEAEKNFNAEQKSMKGFVRINICPKCKKRIEPNAQGVGACPYCKQQVVPDTREFYAGKKFLNSNSYAKLDMDSFQAGKNLQCMQTTRKIIPVNNHPVKVERSA